MRIFNPPSLIFSPKLTRFFPAAGEDFPAATNKLVSQGSFFMLTSCIRRPAPIPFRVSLS